MNDHSKTDVIAIERSIDEYIFEHWLEDGSSLPSSSDLASELACSEDTLGKALDAAVVRGKLSHSDGV